MTEKKMIMIRKPYLKKMKNNSVRLCAMVNYDGTDQEIWYEVDERYSQYLCYERADAFLIAFLPYAMAFKYDIKIEGAISEKLIYQLVNYYIPALGKYSKYYTKINILYDCLDSNNYVTESAVATGFSAGVDSFYTVLKHLNCQEKSFQLTHLTFFKVGATGSFGGEKADYIFDKRIHLFKDYAKMHNLDFVIVDSNVSEHAKMSYNYIHSFRSLSAVLALQKLFKIYYYASASVIDNFSFSPVDSANYDLFNMTFFTAEGMSCYSVDMDFERLDKQNYIKDFPDTYKYLNVCNLEAMNCSKCEKCIRTMVGFQALGCLDNYKDVFDIQYFRNNFAKCIGLLIGKSFDGTAEGNIDASLVKNMKSSGTKIPILAYLYAVPVFIHSFAFRIARKIKPIRKWYHKRMNKKLGCNYAD